MQVFLPEVKQVNNPPSCFSSPTGNMCPFLSYTWCMVFTCLCFSLVIFMLKITPKCRTKMLRIVPKCKKALLCLVEKIHISDNLFSIHDVLGHEFNSNQATNIYGVFSHTHTINPIYVLFSWGKCNQKLKGPQLYMC